MKENVDCVDHQTIDDGFFENLKWLTTEETVKYLRKSTNAVRILVHRKILRARKFQRRLYFRRDELDYLLESSFY